MAGILAGKSALVTGGGSGIGRATALAMAREGARVAVADQTEAAAAETVAMINAGGGQAIAIGADVADEAQVQAMVARSVAGERRIAAKDFYTGLYTTTLQPNEMIVACEIPLANAGQRVAFDELSRRHGDYAVVGLAASARVQDGLLSQVRLAWLGTGSMPQRALAAEQALEGQFFSEAITAQALQALRRELQIEGDLTHSPAAKQHLAGVMLKRALHALTQQSTLQA